MHTAEMSDRKQEEGKPRSPGIAPVAVKVEEGAKPLPDGFSVDREKVIQSHYKSLWCALFRVTH